VIRVTPAARGGVGTEGGVVLVIGTDRRTARRRPRVDGRRYGRGTMKLTVGPLPSAVYWRRRAIVAAGVLGILAIISALLTSGSDDGSPKGRAGGSKPDSSGVGSCSAEHPCVSGSGSGLPSPTASGSDHGTGGDQSGGDQAGGDQAGGDQPGGGEPGGGVPVTDGATVPEDGGLPAVVPPPSTVRVEPCKDGDLALAAMAEKPAYPVGTQPRLKLSITNVSARDCLRDLGSKEQELIVTAGARRIWSSDDCSLSRETDKRVLRPGEKRVYGLRWSARTSQPGCPKTRTAVGADTYQVVARLGVMRSKPAEFALTP
jgi:hypothetical protein